MFAPLLQVDALLADARVHKGLWVVLIWLVALAGSRLIHVLLDRVDERLTTYGVPERRLAKLDFFADVFFILIATFATLFVLGVGQALWGAVAITSVAGILVGLAAQRLAQNILAGIVILFERPFVVGDHVDIGGTTGTVAKVTLHTTTLTSPDGLEIMQPNSKVLDSTLTNFTSNPRRRLVLAIDVQEAVALSEVRGILMRAVEGERHLVKEKGITVFAKESLDEGVRFEVRYWVQRQHYGSHCLPSAMARILEALNEAGLATAMPAQHIRVTEAPGPPAEVL